MAEQLKKLPTLICNIFTRFLVGKKSWGHVFVFLSQFILAFSFFTKPLPKFSVFFNFKTELGSFTANYNVSYLDYNLLAEFFFMLSICCFMYPFSECELNLKNLLLSDNRIKYQIENS